MDLFAFDESPLGYDPDTGVKPSLKPLKRRGRYISGLRRLLFYKTGFQTAPKRKKTAQAILSKFVTVQGLHKRIDKACRKYNGKGCKFVTNFGSMYTARHETFPVGWILPLERVPYGDMEVNVPHQAKRVLRRIYGDWKKWPQYKMRRGKHGFVRDENFEEELLNFESEGDE